MDSAMVLAIHLRVIETRHIKGIGPGSSPSDTNQRNEKISNKSSFGIIDIADDSSTSDRIIVIVNTACFIHDGAYR